MILVGKKAPDFTTAAVLKDDTIINEFNFYHNIEGKYALLFFYPLDFTFVCPSELIALDNKIAQFTERNVEVIAGSIDSQFTHAAWRKTAVKDGGIGPVKFTLIADLQHKICQSYGIEHHEQGVALRGAFIIDQTKIIRHQTINDLPLGRNINELIRTLDALKHYEQHGEVCPAGWNKGDQAMTASLEGVADYLCNNAKNL
jgi:peroxiredoxin 2/4